VAQRDATATSENIKDRQTIKINLANTLKLVDGLSENQK
jgi:hypothetical protein